jgi:hypothetical protein
MYKHIYNVKLARLIRYTTKYILVVHLLDIVCINIILLVFQ